MGKVLKDGSGKRVLQKARHLGLETYGAILTRDLADAIAKDIAGGGLVWTACAAHGVERKVAERWLISGRRAITTSSGRDRVSSQADVGPYAYFYAVVSQAIAAARLSAEQRLSTLDPEKWLHYGMIRDQQEGGIPEEQAEDAQVAEMQSDERIAGMIAGLQELGILPGGGALGAPQAGGGAPPGLTVVESLPPATEEPAS